MPYQEYQNPDFDSSCSTGNRTKNQKAIDIVFQRSFVATIQFRILAFASIQIW